MTTRLEEIEARLAASTPGPWEDIYPNADEGDIRVQVYHAHKRTVVHDVDAVAWKLKAHDATFIAHAPSDIAFLIEALKVATEALEFMLASGLDDGDFHSMEQFRLAQGAIAGRNKAHEALEKLRSMK